MNLSGNILDYVITFWGGVLVSFTPCVYPLIPITASIIGGLNTQGSKVTGFFISLIYVLGIAVTYSAMGIAAALTGKVFGTIQNQPIVYLVVGNVLLVLGLSLLDVIQIPFLGINVGHKVKVKNLWTVLILGIAAGLIVGPCTAPVLGTLLLYVASKQNIAYAASLLFVFSYGVGASLILVGTFSGLLASLPKSGKWLAAVKKFCGFVLLIASEYYFITAGRLMI